MFTIELDEASEDHVITVLDETGENEDVQVIVGKEGDAWIRQFDETENKYDLISLSYKMLCELINAVDLPVGTYRLEEKGNK